MRLSLQAGLTSLTRKVHSFRCDSYLWGLFRDRCKNLGLSTCFVVESLIRAWVTGESQQVPQARPMVINFTCNYEVERPRRHPWDSIPPLPGRRCPECGSPDILDRLTQAGRFREGRCNRCHVEWLITRGNRREVAEDG